MKNKIFILCVIFITLSSLSCLAQSGIYNSGIFADNDYEGMSLSGDYSNNNYVTSFEASSSLSYPTFKSSLTGQKIVPFDDKKHAFFSKPERKNNEGTNNDLPDGNATDEIIVGDGMLIIVFFLMFLMGVRMGRKQED